MPRYNSKRDNFAAVMYVLIWIQISLASAPPPPPPYAHAYPKNHLDTRCHLDMLCIFVTQIRWPKGVLGLSEEQS